MEVKSSCFFTNIHDFNYSINSKYEFIINPILKCIIISVLVLNLRMMFLL